jgi:Secretion system C-terminal sorting domain
MKTRILLFLIASITTQIFAQTYPEVTIRDIQFIGDSIMNAPADYVSPYEGDTVTISGVVMHAIFQGLDQTNDYILHSGGPSVFLQDPNEDEWNGILVRRDYNLTDEGNSLFSLLDSGMVVNLTGFVGEYRSTTQFNLIKFEGSDVVGQTVRPEPVLLTLDSLVELGTNAPKYIAEKYEGVFVEIRNVTVTDEVSTGGFSFGVFDNNNLVLTVDDKSSYFSSLPRPLPGSKIDYIRGFIGNRTDIDPHYFVIDPIYIDDIKFGDVSPPNISNVVRDKGIVKFNEDVVVTTRVIDSDGTAEVDEVKLFYSVNESAFDSVMMILTDPVDSIWSASIPAKSDSSLIRYYISATDMDNALSSNPSNPDNGYFYHVLDRDLTIKDVQYSPFGSGFSGYNNYEVTVSGQVSADTSDIEGDGANIGPQVYIQGYENGPWSGIQIFGVDAETAPRDEHVIVTGIVNENFGVTRIGTLENGVKVEYSLADFSPPIFPEPEVISTSEIGTLSGSSLPAESYEGVLVKIENITILDDNADGSTGPDKGITADRNHGEIYITDMSNVQMRLELQDGTHNYNNFWDASQESSGIRIETGHTFESITGILFYSFGNYKLVPRKNDDFVGHVTDVDEVKVVPEKYSLTQNYPNPFNPTTIINYSIPNVASNFNSSVILKVYDVLGQEVITLVNEVQKPGSYKVNFDAGDFTSGIYFYTIKAGSFYQAKKMMLIK